MSTTSASPPEAAAAPVRRAGPWRRWQRRLVKLCAFLLIALAALSASVRLLLPWLVGDPQRVAHFLSERLRTPVTLESSEALVLGTGPLVHLKGLRIGNEPALVLAEADLELDFAAFVLPWRRVVRDVRVSGLDIRIERGTDGLVRVLGLPRPTAPPPWEEWLGRIGQMSLRDSTLRFVDVGSDTSYVVQDLQARIQRRDGQLRFGAGLGRGVRVVGQYLPGAAVPLTVWLGGGASLAADEGAPLRLAGLTPIRGSLTLDTRLEWLAGGDVRGTLALTADDVVYESHALELSEDQGELAFRHTLPHLALHARMQRAVTDGALRADWHWSTDAAAAPASGALERAADGSLRAAMEGLEISALADLLSATTLVPDLVAERLYLSAPQGRLERLELQRNGSVADDWWVSGQLRGLAFRGWEPRVPHVSGVDLDFHSAAGGSSFTVDAASGTLDSALSFKAPIPFTLKASGSLAPMGARTRIEIDRFDVQSLAGDAFGHLQLDLGDGQAPWLDLSGKVRGGDMRSAKQFWVLNKMPARAVQWLDRALVDGRVTAGGAVYRGELGKPAWPFAEQQGRFQAYATVAGATLDYHPDWPRAESLDAELEFINDGLRIVQASGRVGGTRITAQAQLPVFKEPILSATFNGEGDARAWLAFLRSSPVGMAHGSQLVGMEASGPVLATAHMKLPLKRTLGEAELDGKATLDGVDLRDPKWMLDFRAMRGSARFTRAGFAGEGIALQTPSGSNGELAIAIGLTAEPAQVVEASLVGSFTTQDLFGHHEVLSPILARISGRSDWQLELAVPRADDAGPSTLKMFSALRGTRIDMPAPLGKEAPGARNLALQVGLPLEAALPLTLNLGDAARMEARLGTATQDFSGVLRLGPGAIEAKRPERGLWLEGSAPDNEPQAWMALVASLVAGTEEGDSGFVGANMVLTPAAPDAAPGHLVIETGEQGWTFDIDSQLAAGKLVWELRHGQEGIHADFSHLHLPADATSGGAQLGLDPARLPALHLRAQDFRMGAAQLGELRLETFPVADGMQVELMESRSAVLELRGQGQWTGHGNQQRSSFDVRFSAQDAGRMLSSLGFAGQMSGGQTLSTLKASWPGAPSDFGLEHLDGSLDIWIGSGRFLEVEPGAGRLFGLLSLSELPRRLSLDFRDFFQSGMAFDEIKGRFALNEGNAWTENLAITAPAANVMIFGRTGIAARDYDQQMVVTPKVGGVLPIVGALAGGPGGAAAGLLAQRMFSGERAAFLREYRIGGTWDKPQIERQDTRRSQARGGALPPG